MSQSTPAATADGKVGFSAEEVRRGLSDYAMQQGIDAIVTLEEDGRFCLLAPGTPRGMGNGYRLQVATKNVDAILAKIDQLVAQKMRVPRSPADACAAITKYAQEKGVDAVVILKEDGKTFLLMGPNKVPGSEHGYGAQIIESPRQEVIVNKVERLARFREEVNPVGHKRSFSGTPRRSENMEVRKHGITTHDDVEFLINQHFDRRAQGFQDAMRLIVQQELSKLAVQMDEAKAAKAQRRLHRKAVKLLKQAAARFTRTQSGAGK